MLSHLRSKVADESGSVVIGVVLLIFVLYFVFFLLFINNWAASPEPSNNDNLIYGFLQGVFAVPAFFVSLFDDKIAVYQVANIGGWYDFGFLVGIGALFGSRSSSTD